MRTPRDIDDLLSPSLLAEYNEIGNLDHIRAGMVLRIPAYTSVFEDSGIDLVVVPYDSGRRGWRMGGGPLRLVEAGIVERLRDLGHDVRRTDVELATLMSNFDADRNGSLTTPGRRSTRSKRTASATGSSIR